MNARWGPALVAALLLATGCHTGDQRLRTHEQHVTIHRHAYERDAIVAWRTEDGRPADEAHFTAQLQVISFGGAIGSELDPASCIIVWERGTTHQPTDDLSLSRDVRTDKYAIVPCGRSNGSMPVASPDGSVQVRGHIDLQNPNLRDWEFLVDDVVRAPETVETSR